MKSIEVRSMLLFVAVANYSNTVLCRCETIAFHLFLANIFTTRINGGILHFGVPYAKQRAL